MKVKTWFRNVLLLCLLGLTGCEKISDGYSKISDGYSKVSDGYAEYKEEKQKEEINASSTWSDVITCTRALSSMSPETESPEEVQCAELEFSDSPVSALGSSTNSSSRPGTPPSVTYKADTKQGDESMLESMKSWVVEKATLVFNGASKLLIWAVIGLVFGIFLVKMCDPVSGFIALIVIGAPCAYFIYNSEFFILSLMGFIFGFVLGLATHSEGW